MNPLGSVSKKNGLLQLIATAVGGGRNTVPSVRIVCGLAAFRLDGPSRLFQPNQDAKPNPMESESSVVSRDQNNEVAQ